MLEVMDFPGRRGHQSPFTARLAGPAESGSQSSDAGTLVGEEERGPHSPGVGRPPSLQQGGLAGVRAGPADREEASRRWKGLALWGPASPRLLFAREPRTASHRRKPRKRFSSPSDSGFIRQIRNENFCVSVTALSEGQDVDSVCGGVTPGRSPRPGASLAEGRVANLRCHQPPLYGRPRSPERSEGKLESPPLPPLFTCSTFCDLHRSTHWTDRRGQRHR